MVIFKPLKLCTAEPGQRGRPRISTHQWAARHKHPGAAAPPQTPPPLQQERLVQVEMKTAPEGQPGHPEAPRA